MTAGGWHARVAVRTARSRRRRTRRAHSLPAWARLGQVPSESSADGEVEEVRSAVSSKRHSVPVAQRFRLELTNRRIARVLDLETGLGHFSAPASTPALPKIYAALHSRKPVYVGVTRQPVRARLRLGEMGRPYAGPYGYKWMVLRSVDLFVWTFRDLSDRDAETVEAEVVYEIRKRLGQWPAFQNEIHFWKSTRKHRQIATRLATVLLGGKTSG